MIRVLGVLEYCITSTQDSGVFGTWNEYSYSLDVCHRGFVPMALVSQPHSHHMHMHSLSIIGDRS